LLKTPRKVVIFFWHCHLCGESRHLIYVLTIISELERLGLPQTAPEWKKTRKPVKPAAKPATPLSGSAPSTPLTATAPASSVPVTPVTPITPSVAPSVLPKIRISVGQGTPPLEKTVEDANSKPVAEAKAPRSIKINLSAAKERESGAQKGEDLTAEAEKPGSIKLKLSAPKAQVVIETICPIQSPEQFKEYKL